MEANDVYKLAQVIAVLAGPKAKCNISIDTDQPPGTQVACFVWPSGLLGGQPPTVMARADNFGDAIAGAIHETLSNRIKEYEDAIDGLLAVTKWRTDDGVTLREVDVALKLIGKDAEE